MDEKLYVHVEPLSGQTSDLLSLAPDPTGLLCWSGGRREIIGWGEALRQDFQGPHAIRDAARFWDRLVENTVVDGGDLSIGYPLALASFGFAASTPGYLIVPEIALVRQGESVVVVTSAQGGTPESAEHLLARAAEARRPIEAPVGLWTDPGRMTQGQWQAAVKRLITLLQAGAASKVVLTRDLVASSAVPIDERHLVKRLLDLYPTTWVYAVRGLIGATPEMLAAMEGDRVVSKVLAGTSAPGHGDELLASLKNRSEHHFAVESVARALSPLAEHLEIPTEPQLLDLPNVTHLATEVTATVSGLNLLDVVSALHPTAAVCGTPTKLAFDILENIEGTQRGRYSGPVGWIDASGGGEFGIALRCGQLSDDQHTVRVFAGGGIMPDSIPEVELAETRAKMRPILEALGIAD